VHQAYSDDACIKNKRERERKKKKKNQQPLQHCIRDLHCEKGRVRVTLSLYLSLLCDCRQVGGGKGAGLGQPALLG